MRRSSSLLFASVLCIALGLTFNRANAQEACANDFEKASGEISSKSDPELKATAAEIKKLQGIGVDPNRYIVQFEGKDVPITVKYYVLASRKVDALQQAQDTASKCSKDVMPLRIASDLATIYLTDGLSLLLPDQATRVDWAEIIKNGKPLGGDQALIPKARDDVLNAVGLDKQSTPGHFLRDPKCIFGKC